MPALQKTTGNCVEAAGDKLVYQLSVAEGNRHRERDNSWRCEREPFLRATDEGLTLATFANCLFHCVHCPQQHVFEERCERYESNPSVKKGAINASSGDLSFLLFRSLSCMSFAFCLANKRRNRIVGQREFETTRLPVLAGVVAGFAVEMSTVRLQWFSQDVFA